MAESETSAPMGPSAPIRADLRIDRIYLRDLSFESPQAPGVFASEWKPQFQIELNTRADRLDDGRFEVVLALNLEAKSGENTLLMVELQQAGIFHIEGVDGERLRETLGMACPAVLFPYARETVADGHRAWRLNAESPEAGKRGRHAMDSESAPGLGWPSSPRGELR